MKDVVKAAKKPAAKAAKGESFTAEEKAAMRERAKEQKAAGSAADAEAEVVAKIAGFKPADRVLGERIHALVKEHAPGLTSRLWYGMPAYANAAGKVVLHFKDAAKFKTRYATLGFSDAAKLDDGNVWATEFALAKLTAADEKRIAALLKQAIG